jgi:hypothetical protein
MKTVRIILGIVAGLAAIVGIVYVVATYGNRIAAWATATLRRFKERFSRTKFYGEDSIEASEGDFETV